MKTVVLLFAFILVNVLGYARQDTVLHFSFNESSGFNCKEEVSGRSFTVSTIKKNLEIVPSLFGSGLRTDGYSTSVKAGLSVPLKNTFNISGWFALETYPTDTAGFFVIKNSSDSSWVSACINQFGYPLIGIHENGNTKYISGDNSIAKFQWFQIALSFDKSKIEMFVNGKSTVVYALHGKKPDRYDSFVIGKDERNKTFGVFPTEYINGIIDDVVVINKAADENSFSNFNYGKIKSIIPNLNIPAIRFANDFNRPQYHLLPAANWTNETHGLIFYKGRYHIFNQKNGNNLILRNINWGHFTSPDLLHWTEQRPAISPAPGYDQSGIWSGHCVIGPDNKPAIFYSAASSDTSFGVCLALPEDDSLLHWKKYDDNPVVKGTPKQYERVDFHDPYLWKENDTYYMVVGYGIDELKTRRGALLLYKSNDFKQWQFLHTLFEGNPEYDGSGVFWEMPVFWKENGKYILLVNKVPYKKEPANAMYWVGDFVNEKFVPDNKTPRTLEVINQLLSPSVAKDENGLTTAIAIIPDLIPPKAQYEQGWTHLYSIPRTWVLKGDKICQQPHPSMQSLRGEKKGFLNKEIPAGKPLLLSSGEHQLEMEMEFIPENCSGFSFIIGKHPENKEFTKITYDFGTQEFSVDKTKSSLNKNIIADGRSGKYKLNKNEKVNIRLFIDGSVAEVFINNEDAFTTRIFPSLKESTNVELTCDDGTIKLANVNVWKLKNTNNKTNF